MKCRTIIVLNDFIRCGAGLTVVESYLCYEAVEEQLLGPEPLDLLVDPLVLLQLLQVCPAAVEV